MTLKRPSAHRRLCQRDRHVETSPCHVRRLLLEGQRSAVDTAHCQRPEPCGLQSYQLLRSRTAAAATGSECPHEVPAAARRSAWPWVRWVPRHRGLQQVLAVGFCSWGPRVPHPWPRAGPWAARPWQQICRVLAACTQECLVGSSCKSLSKAVQEPLWTIRGSQLPSDVLTC